MSSPENQSQKREILAIFSFENKSIKILCPYKKKIKEMLQDFINKINPESRIIDFTFTFEGNLIESSTYEQKIEESELFKDIKDVILISVDKNIKILQCPKCNYGDCVVSLIDYKTTFYNCEHKHLVVSSYDKYFNDQIYFCENVRCAGNNCETNARMDPNFFLCLTCSKLLNNTKSFCSRCIKKHNNQYNDEAKDVIINYEDKNYYCKNHIKRMETYCFDCKTNLCSDCVLQHKDHKIKSIDSLIPTEREITELKNSLKDIKKKLKLLKEVVDDLIYKLNGGKRLYEKYYKIASTIFEKYESFNKGEKDFKNFTIFKTLRNLRISNNQILEGLDSIINEKDNFNKAKELIEIYSKKKKKYYANSDIGDDLNKEDDAEWYNEVLLREKEKEEEEKKKAEEKEKEKEKKEKKDMDKKK